MRIAIVHYHLRPGGVTRVIERAARVLRERGVEAVVLSGEPAVDSPPELPVTVVPGLAYDTGAGKDTPAGLKEALAAEAHRRLGAPPDLWHFHNHALGKNVLLPEVVYAMASEGAKLLLQLHDFAEDGRPANYRELLRQVGGGDEARLTARLYPQAPHVQYAPLNSRDERFLQRAGIPGGRVHLLSNPIIPLGLEPSNAATGGSGGEAALFLYPTRGIRRKNVGEFLLWSAVAEPGRRFAMTLAPRNPAARPVYDRWVAFAGEQALPVEFEAGVKQAYTDLVQEAAALVTTSVAEGFGLAFLEPWLEGKVLLGRDLPDVTAEFQENHVDLTNLYTRLDVPLDWLGADPFRSRLAEAMSEYLASYGRTIKDEHVERAWGGAVQDGHVDFGRLDESMQETVIRRVKETPAARDAIAPGRLRLPSNGDELIQTNGQAVRNSYNLARYGDRLAAVYHTVTETTPAALESLADDAVLKQFLSPERFSLLRT